MSPQALQEIEQWRAANARQIDDTLDKGSALADEFKEHVELLRQELKDTRAVQGRVNIDIAIAYTKAAKELATGVYMERSKAHLYLRAAVECFMMANNKLKETLPARAEYLHARVVRIINSQAQ